MCIRDRHAALDGLLVAAAAGGLPGDRAFAHCAQRPVPDDPDVGYNLPVCVPVSYTHLDMLERAIFDESGPVAVRYPRGGEGEYTQGLSLIHI